MEPEASFGSCKQFGKRRSSIMEFLLIYTSFVLYKVIINFQCVCVKSVTRACNVFQGGAKFALPSARFCLHRNESLLSRRMRALFHVQMNCVTLFV